MQMETSKCSSHVLRHSGLTSHRRKDLLVVYEYEEIKSSIELDQLNERNVGWKSLFSTPGNLKRLRIFGALAFFSNGLEMAWYRTTLPRCSTTSASQNPAPSSSSTAFSNFGTFSGPYSGHCSLTRLGVARSSLFRQLGCSFGLRSKPSQLHVISAPSTIMLLMRSSPSSSFSTLSTSMDSYLSYTPSSS